MVREWAFSFKFRYARLSGKTSVANATMHPNMGDVIVRWEC